MKYVDLNMGLMGARFALPAAHLCLLHVPGDALADSLWRSQRKQVVSLPALEASVLKIHGSTDAVFSYISHRDIQAWARSPAHPSCAGTFMALERLRPMVAVLCSTKSAPKVQKGFPFLCFLKRLEASGYSVSWFTASAKSCGLPHDAHYTIIVCFRCFEVKSRIGAIASAVGTSLGGKREELGLLVEQMDARSPRIGASRRALTPLPSAGGVCGGVMFSVSSKYAGGRTTAEALTLGEIVSPHLAHLKPRPVRLVSRNGISGPMFKNGNVSYALGPGTSASPLFAFEPDQTAQCDRERLVDYANWTSTRDGNLIIRLNPSRAVLLHGSSAGEWEDTLQRSGASLESLYALISRGLAPCMLRSMVEALKEVT